MVADGFDPLALHLVTDRVAVSQYLPASQRVVDFCRKWRLPVADQKLSPTEGYISESLVRQVIQQISTSLKQVRGRYQVCGQTSTSAVQYQTISTNLVY